MAAESPHYSLYCARFIWSLSGHAITLRSILVLLSHLFKAPSDIQVKNVHALRFSTMHAKWNKRLNCDPSAFMTAVYILMRNLSVVSYLLKITRVLQIVSIIFYTFIYFTDIRRQLLFNIISFLLDPWSPTIFKLLDATVKKSFCLITKLSCTASFTSSSSTNQQLLRAFLRGPKWWKSEGSSGGL